MQSPFPVHWYMEWVAVKKWKRLKLQKVGATSGNVAIINSASMTCKVMPHASRPNGFTEKWVKCSQKKKEYKPIDLIHVHWWAQKFEFQNILQLTFLMSSLPKFKWWNMLQMQCSFFLDVFEMLKYLKKLLEMIAFQVNLFYSDCFDCLNFNLPKRICFTSHILIQLQWNSFCYLSLWVCLLAV